MELCGGNGPEFIYKLCVASVPLTKQGQVEVGGERLGTHLKVKRVQGTDLA